MPVNTNFTRAIVRPTVNYTVNTAHTTYNTNAAAPPVRDTVMTEDIDRRFQIVEREIKEQKVWQTEQKQWNAEMNTRMHHLEGTTTNTDGKVDMILTKLDSWDIHTKRRGVSTTSEERSAPYPLSSENSGALQP
jgi:hypothetical protein